MARRAEEQFSRNAGDYRDEPLFAEGEDLGWMVEAAAPTGAEDLLDVGSGAGHTAIAFAPRVRSCLGVDVTAAMVRVAADLAAARGLGNVRFAVAAAEALPLPDRSFDLVTCRFAAHHFVDLRAAVASVARVLRPGGTLLLVDQFAPDDPETDGFINEMDRLRDPSHVRACTLPEVAELLAGAGLSCEVRRRWDLLLPFDSWVRRARVAPEARRRLAAMFRTAPAPCRDRFDLRLDPAGEPVSFRLPCALLRGGRCEGPPSRGHPLPVPPAGRGHAPPVGSGPVSAGFCSGHPGVRAGPPRVGHRGA